MSKKQKADDRRISEMRNLGPACERDLNAVGIYTAGDLIRLGEESAFLKMLEGGRRRAEGRRAEGPAVYIAQPKGPEGLGFWFRDRGEGQRPGSLLCETTSEIPCDLLTAGPLALYDNSSCVSQPFRHFRLGQVNG